MASSTVTDTTLLDEIRLAIKKICADYPGTYWQELDRNRAYPTNFVNALTESGWLAALIPEEYGGSGLTMEAATVILEEIHANGCNAAACHAQMYTMGTVMRHGSGRIEELIYLGDHIRCRMTVAGNNEFIVKVPNTADQLGLEIGAESYVSWQTDDCRALDFKES